MNWSIIKKDLKRNKLINTGLLLFILLSACLTVLSVILAVQTITSISALYQVAQPPHFLQMHKGELDQEKLEEFMEGYPGLEAWQTVTMVNLYGENIEIRGEDGTYTLADLRLDIGLVKQNEERDLLLDSSRQKVELQPGEIGFPVLLRDRYGMEIGDKVILRGSGLAKTFTIQEFVLDSQMNSPLTSSTRILLSDPDFEIVAGNMGELEYLIEGYFSNKDDAAAFKTAYENAGLPQNGQAVTYTIIFLLSALTDMMMVFLLLLVSGLLVLVAFTCVRFTILAAIEEEILEIGTMKAIGLPFSDIRGLYLNKYRALGGAGVIGGYLVALAASGILTRNISTTFGSSGISLMAILASLLAAFLILILVELYSRKVLKRIRKITVVDALASGKGFGKQDSCKNPTIHQSRKMPVDWLLGIREIFYYFRNWFVVFLVVAITMMMVLIPAKLLSTFESPEFITYMGSSQEDILLEVENGEGLEERAEKAMAILEKDESIEAMYQFRTLRIQTLDKDGQTMNLDVDSGDQAGKGLKYLSGKAPRGDGEIALSFLNAEETGKRAGDSIALQIQNETREFQISGIYQDVTSGGYTAKSAYSFSGVESSRYTISVDLKNPVDAEKKAEEWSRAIGSGVSVDPMEEFIDQTLGGVSRQLRVIVLVVTIIGLSLVILISALFLKLRLARDLSETAILKAIGFSERDIRKQYLIKMGGVSAAGILTGILLIHGLASSLISGALGFAGIGIRQVELVTEPGLHYLAFPLILLILIGVVTWIVSGSVKNQHLVDVINE